MIPRSERAHNWTAMLVFAGFEILVAVSAIAIIAVAARGK